MRSKPLLRKFFAACTALALMVSLTIAAVPFLVDGSSIKQTLATRLAQFTGGQVALRGRVGLESFLSLTVEAETIEIAGVTKLGPVIGVVADRVTGSIDWWDLLRGDLRFDKVTVEGARIEAKRGGDGQILLSEAMNALEDAPFETIVAVNSSVVADGEPTPLKVVSGRLSRSTKGRRLTLRAQLLWKDEPLTVKARRGRKRTTVAGVSAPVDFTVSGLPLNLAFTGEMAFTPAMTLRGDVEFASADVSALPGWLDVAWSLPETLTSMTVEGRLAWSAEKIALDRVAVMLNRNDFSGSLSLRLVDACPVIDGALAFRVLDLTPLAFQRGAPTLNPCLKADLSISAENFMAGALSGGATAAAVRIENAKIMANVAEAEMFRGSLRGNFEADLSQSTPVWVVRATGQDLDAGLVAEFAHLDAWVDGQASANVEFKASGRTPREMLQSMTGQAKINFPAGGALGLPIAESLSAVSSGAVTLADLTPLQFTRLRVDLSAADGALAARAFEMSSDRSTVSGRGSLDLRQGAFDGRMEVRSALADMGALQAVQSPDNGAAAVQIVSINGTAQEPRVSLNGQPMTIDKKSHFAPF
ncbi:MAG: AsmA-like C-terminal region-containing protein [Hyphomicrobiales bacterium]|nr:AsmA-like C-terminal region-containing protein [Hyphomicrobiales bacterium]